MSGLIQYDDGSWGRVDEDGFVDELDTTISLEHALDVPTICIGITPRELRGRER